MSKKKKKKERQHRLGRWKRWLRSEDEPPAMPNEAALEARSFLSGDAERPPVSGGDVVAAAAEILADRALSSSDPQEKKRAARALEQIASSPEKATAKHARKQIHRVKAAAQDETIGDVSVPRSRPQEMGRVERKQRYPCLMRVYAGETESWVVIVESRQTGSDHFNALSVRLSALRGVLEQVPLTIPRNMRKGFYADVRKSSPDLEMIEVDMPFALTILRRAMDTDRRLGRSSPPPCVLFAKEIAQDEPLRRHPALDIAAGAEPLKDDDTALHMRHFLVARLLPPEPDWSTLLPRLESGTESGLSLTGGFLMERRKELLLDQLEESFDEPTREAYSSVFYDSAHLASVSHEPEEVVVWLARMGGVFADSKRPLRRSAFFEEMASRLATIAEMKREAEEGERSTGPDDRSSLIQSPSTGRQEPSPGPGGLVLPGSPGFGRGK
jgi:hypothetical protein